MTEKMRDIFDRIPALSELRGGARLAAEEVLQNALDDAAEECIVDCDRIAMTGRAP